MTYTQELECAVRKLLLDVIDRHPEIKRDGFKCPHMQRLSDLIDLAWLPETGALDLELNSGQDAQGLQSAGIDLEALLGIMQMVR